MSARSRNVWATQARLQNGNGGAASIGAVGRANVTLAQQRRSTRRARRSRLPNALFLAKRTEADFQAWREQRAWTAEKYRRFDRGERQLAGAASRHRRPWSRPATVPSHEYRKSVIRRSMLHLYENIREQVAADLRSPHRLLSEMARQQAERLREELDRRGLRYSYIDWR